MNNIQNTTKRIRLALIALCTGFMSLFSACHYLDIVPDNIATLDYAFRLRSQAEKYLFTCYSYLPKLGSWSNNPGLLSGDEIWFFYPYEQATSWSQPPGIWEVARGNQNLVDPYLNYWDGSRGGSPLYQAIRDCNTFLDNIDKVPDMDDLEKEKWAAEVRFLKAYYHWFLLRMYGPIPLIKRNIPVSAGVEAVKVYRQPVDSCFNYIVSLIDSAATDLPDEILDKVDEQGRITRPIALAIKARILVTAASPLFNGNTDFADLKDKKGQLLFNSHTDSEKWARAAAACQEAIDACQAVGHQLYAFNPAINSYNLGPEMTIRMSIRNAICEKWNSEVIWGANNSMVGALQRFVQPNIDPNVEAVGTANAPKAEYAPTLRIAEMFYTENGVPIDEDKTWDYRNRYGLDTATEADQLEIAPGYVTARLNFNREPRFYADLGFDGGIWYGQGRFDELDTWHVEGRLGMISGKSRGDQYSITGYYAKKLVNFLNVTLPNGNYQIQTYPWPVIRLSDLYLLYAEALNEVNGPTQDALHWIDLVRERAGIPSVEDAWLQYAKQPNAYTTQDGLRKIIHRERLIEMAFEGNRYWDLRRWKEMENMMNQPIRGWNVTQEDPQFYYQPTSLFTPTFKKRDYFWPIKEHAIIVNNNLVQNPGW